MACSNVFDAFAVATENLSDEIYRLASYKSLWLNVIPRGVYDRGKGLTKTTFTIGRQEPSSDEETWDSITLADGDNQASCNPTLNDVTWGYTARNYSPEQLALQGPIVCRDDLTFDHSLDAFLEAYITAMSIRAQRSWEKRYEKLFIDFSRKGIARANFSLTASDATLTQPISTSTITQQMLDRVAVDLINSGATMPDSQGFYSLGGSGPRFTLYIGMEASQDIQKNNSEFRNDIRWAYSGAAENAPLMMRLGATVEIKNFLHAINPFPPRYTYNGTTYVRVATFSSSAGTKGTIYSVNSAWESAPYEAAIVVTPWVFTSEIVMPDNAAPGVEFDPVSYMGEWKFITGAYKFSTDCVDPWDNRGRHIALFKHAPRPKYPNFGITIIFKRCPINNFDEVYCT